MSYSSDLFKELQKRKLNNKGNTNTKKRWESSSNDTYSKDIGVELEKIRQSTSVSDRAIARALLLPNSVNEKRSLWEDDEDEEEEIAPIRTTTANSLSDIAPTTKIDFGAAERKRKASEVPRLYRGGGSSPDLRSAEGIRKDFERYEKEQLIGEDWINTSLFNDGYDFGDITRAAASTVVDLGSDAIAGIVSAPDKVRDAAIAVDRWLKKNVLGHENENFDKETAELIAKDWINEQAVGDFFLKNPYEYITGEDVEKVSVAGEKADALAVSAGELAVQIGADMLLPGSGMALMATSSFGSEVENALNNGATLNEAIVSAGVTALTEVVTERLGGFKFGGKATVADKLTKSLTKNLNSQLAKAGVKLGVGGTFEGLEEILSGHISAVGQHFTYMSDKEISEIFSSQDALDSFIGGFVLGDIGEGVEVRSANKKGVDVITGLTKNEQAVVDKVVADEIAEREKDGKKLTNKEKNEIYDATLKKMERGYIGTDTIESVLGGETYKNYQSMVEQENSLKADEKKLTKEIDAILDKENPTLRDRERLAEARKELASVQETLGTLDTKTAKNNLFNEVDKLTANDTKLRESYNERQRAREDFKADFEKFKGTKHEDAAKKTIENAIKAGANNTNAVHDIVDFATHVSAETGKVVYFKDGEQITSDFIERKTKEIAKLEAVENRSDAENEKIARLKDLVAKVQSGEVVVNGTYDSNGIVLNLDSKKPLNRIVGHEVTHAVEKAKNYNKLRDSLFTYAKSKGVDIDAELAMKELEYEGVEGTTAEAELVADLVGDYLFTDSDFVNSLTTSDRNLAQRVYDTIKHLYNMATAGSKEARQLEKVKYAFEQAFRESAEKNTADSGVKHDITVLDNGNVYVTASRKVIKGTTKAEQRREIASFFSVLLDGKPSLDIHTIEGDVLTITKKETANKARDDYKTVDGQQIQMTDDEFAVKMHIESHIDEIAEVSKPLKNKQDNKNHPFAKDGFTYRRAYFEDFDGQYYEVTLSIGNNGTIATVYNVGKIKGSVPPSAKVIAVVGSKPLGGTLPNGDISQNGEKVKEKFSLSNAVEETKDLVALHNLTADKLTKSLELGGLPMPSLAITKADIPHTNFGDITLVFGKETIDPKANKKNKVYSADAWTPTFPNVEYEADSKVVNRVSQKLDSLSGLVDEYFRNDLSTIGYSMAIEHYLNRQGGEEGLIQYVMDNYGLKAAYLEDTGKHIEKVTKQEEVPRNFNPESADKYEKVMEILGVNTVEEVWDVNLKEARDNHGAELEAVYPGITKSGLRMGKVIGMVGSYLKGKDSPIEYKTVTDSTATEKAVDDAIDAEGYEAWVRNLFSGVVKDSGIYNNKDLFTPSGNRRSFKQTHLPVTLENIVKAMASQNDGNAKNVSSFNGVKTLRASTAETFKSIDEMHKRKDRLQHLTQEQADEITNALQSRLFKVIESIDTENDQRGDRNSFIRYDQIGEAIAEIGESGKYGVADIQDVFSQRGRTVSDDTALEVKQLLYDVTQMPVNIFEAKPQRVVSFDEAKVFVIPYNSDAKLKQELLNRGYSIAEYDPNVEGDRQRVVNQFEEYKFSLSTSDNDIAPIGKFDFYGKDFRKKSADGVSVEENATANEAPVVEEAPIAPVADNAPTTAENTQKTDARRAAEYRLAEADEMRDMGITPEVDKMQEQLENRNMATAQTPIGQRWHIQKKSNGKYYVYVEGDGSGFVQNVYEAECNSFEEAYLTAQEYFLQQDPDTVSAILKDYETTAPVAEDLAPVANDAKVTEEADRRSVAESVIDKDSFTSDRATELYEEITNLKKGVKASKSLGYLLDHGHEWRSIKTALLNIRDNPNQVVNENSAAETVAREMIGREYEEKVQSLSEPSDVAESIRIKMQNIQTEISNNEALREQSYADYDSEIAEVQAEYDAKKNKNTIVANSLLRRIERLKRMQAQNDANFEKRISDLNARLEKMSKPTYKTAMQRKKKQAEYTSLMENLVGDTSTWRDKKLGISYKVNTLRRNLRDVVRDANGKPDIAKADAIDDELEGNYNRNEADLKREDNRIKSPIAELELTKAEYVYSHMLGEFRHNPDSTLTEATVKEYYEKHKRKIDTKKVDKAIDETRKIFDDLFERVNERLREQGMKEIPYRKGYFPHFTNPKQGFLGKLFNWKKVDHEIPTSIAGITETFNPERSWQSFSKERKSDITDYDLAKALDTYVHGALDWIYHIEDIQKRRALENHIRYIHSDEGVKARINEIRNNEELDADEMQDQIDLVYAEAKNPLNNFVTDLRAGTNTLAAKKSSMDRALEEKTNRQIYSAMTNLNNRISANMVVGSISSAFTNFIPIVQSWTQVSPVYSLRAMGNTIRSTARDDGMIAKSTFLTNRLIEEEKLYQSGWDKASNKAAFLMNAIDSFSSQTVWRSKYLQNISEGMSEVEAIKNADQFAENVIAGRSRGNMPTVFDAKNPLTKIFTAFQLEVNNQYQYMFKDAPQDSKNKARLVKGYATMFLGSYFYNALYSSLVGRDAAFDPIGIIEELIGDLGDEEEEEEALTNFAENIAQEIPFIGGLLGGGRVPISSAIPYSGEYGGLGELISDVSDGKWEDFGREMLKPLYYLALPFGGGQIKKTNEGIAMYSNDHPVAGSYTSSGNLRFPVEDDFWSKAQAVLFGQYSSENARDYFDNNRSPLKEKQIQEYIDVDIPIRDYWEYREGLAEQDTLEEKFDYIAGLDLPVAKKNILINNIVDRDEDVDMKNYDDFNDYEEFDYSVKHPGKYAISKAISDDFTVYYNHQKYLDELDAKDENGETVSGLKKERVLDYINNLDIDYGAKIILYRSMYNSKSDRATYNMEIVDYLNSRDDISYDEMVAILKELDFNVEADGTVWWE